jgi:hypothetical protein
MPWFTLLTVESARVDTQSRPEPKRASQKQHGLGETTLAAAKLNAVLLGVPVPVGVQETTEQFSPVIRRRHEVRRWNSFVTSAQVLA